MGFVRGGTIALLTFGGLGAAEADEDSGHFLFDIGLGLPKLESDDLKLSGELMVGWQTQNFTIAARGGAGWFDFQDPSAILSKNARAFAGLDGGYVSGAPTDLARFEATLSAGFAYLDTQFFDLRPNPSTGLFNQHHSTLLRGLGLVGGRLAGERWALRLLLGGGVQYEMYSDLRVSVDITSNQITRLSVHAEARLFGRVELVERIVGLHLSLLAQRFEVTRDALGVTLSPRGGIGLEADILDTSELDLVGRLGIDVSALEFFGFMPAVLGGLEVVSISSRAGDRTTIVPSIGLGLVRRGAWE